MSTRTVTYDLTLITGSAAASKVVTFDLLTPFAARSADTVVQITFSSTSDENGAGTVTLAVPSSGAYLYSCTLPDGQSFRFSLASGSATTLHALMAATVGSTVTSADAITTAVDAAITTHNADTTSVHGITDTSALVTTSDYTAADVLGKLLTVDGTGTGLDADTVDGSHASAFEAALGNPGADGYVLSSTTGGARSWVAQSAGASDVGDLTTTTGSSTNMLRVAAAGGLEYRTTAQVLGDIGAAPTASPTFTGTVTLPTTVASVIKPASDSTTALQLANAAGTSVVTVDTTNSKLKIKEIEIWTGGITENIGIAAGTSLRSGSTGTRNIAIGNAALGNLTSGGSNVTIGFFAGIAITSGSSNTAIGASAQRNGNPSGTIAIGVDAANGNTGNDCVIIGNLVGKTNTTNSKFLLGNNATLSLLDGIMSTTVAASSLKINGLTGLGTNATPTAYADIAASTTAAASLRIRSGTAPTTPNAGDIWFDGTNLKMHDGTTTRTISWT